MRVICFILLFLIIVPLHAQPARTIDSLTKELQKYEDAKKARGLSGAVPADTLKANILFALIWSFVDINSDTIPNFAQPCLKLSEEIGYKKGMAYAYTGMGYYYNDKQNYPRTLECHQKALALRKEIGDYPAMAYSSSQIGIAYNDLGNHAEALNSFLDALHYSEKVADSVNIARSYCLLAGMERMQSRENDAATHYL